MNQSYSYLKLDDKLNPEVGELPLRSVLSEFIRSTREGQMVRVTLDRIRGTRTQKMNNYLHWMFRLIAKETGLNVDAVKESMKLKYLSDSFEHNGKAFHYVKDTSKLSIPDMMEFIQEIRQYWFDFIGLDIPEPDKIKE